VARLIVLNGPPGVGKTTMARRYVGDHPLALDVELDGIRRRLGAWRDDPLRAGLVARSLTLALARAHLTGGHDVVLPQYLARPEFVAEAEAVARDTGAEFVELVLMDDRDTVVRRFAERTAAAAEPAHVDAGWVVERAGGADALFTMYDRLLLLLSARPGARVIDCPEGAQDEVYARILSAVS
jgi:predicted kinase